MSVTPNSTMPVELGRIRSERVPCAMELMPLALSGELSGIDRRTGPHKKYSQHVLLLKLATCGTGPSTRCNLRGICNRHSVTRIMCRQRVESVVMNTGSRRDKAQMAVVKDVEGGGFEIEVARREEIYKVVIF